VLVAVDTATPNAPALQAGAGLAAALGARLEALFVENADLVHLGGLPFASEISALTGAWHELAVDEIERALRLEAARIERLVANVAEQARVPWSFDRARGRLVAQAVAREAELTILGVADRAIDVARRMAAPRRAQPALRSLAVLFDASPASHHALEITGQLAEALGSELRVLIPSAAAAPNATIRDRAEAWLAARGRAGLALPVDSGEGSLANALRFTRSDLLVHGVADLGQSLRSLIALVAQVSCPVLVVRAARAAA
jgi:hypothetical protein